MLDGKQAEKCPTKDGGRTLCRGLSRLPFASSETDQLPDEGSTFMILTIGVALRALSNTRFEQGAKDRALRVLAASNRRRTAQYAASSNLRNANTDEGRTGSGGEDDYNRTHTTQQLGQLHSCPLCRQARRSGYAIKWFFWHCFIRL